MAEINKYPFLTKPKKISEQKWSNEVPPLVSIACITYNQEEMIKDAIESFLMQVTSFRVMIHIHDDASTDKTAKVINSYVQKYPNLFQTIFQKENKRSQGIKPRYEILYPSITNSKYIANCDGDDYWTDPLKLQKQVDFMEAHPDYGLVHTDVNHLYEINREFIHAYNKTNNIKVPEGKVFEKLLPFSHIIKTKTVLARADLIKNAIKNISTYNKQFVVGDLPLWLELALVSKFKYLPEVTATYRLGIESASILKNISKKIDYDYGVYNLRMFYWSKYSKNPAIKERLEKDKEQLAIAHEQLKKELKEVNPQILEYYSKESNVEQLSQYLNNVYHNNDQSFMAIANAVNNIISNKNNEINHLKEELNRYSSSTSYLLGNKLVDFFKFLKK